MKKVEESKETGRKKGEIKRKVQLLGRHMFRHA